MSRIDRTQQIGHLIKALRHKESGAVSNNKSTSKSSSESSIDSINQLKSDIKKAIHQLNIDHPQQRENARKILISKMIRWQFDSLPLSASHMVFLVNSVNEAIKNSQINNTQLEALLNEFMQ